MKKTISFEVPDILAQKIEGNFPISTLKERNWRDRVCKFIHILHFKEAQDPNGWCEIGSKYLRKIFNGDYKFILDQLKGLGIIEFLESNTSLETYTTQKVYDDHKILLNTRKRGVCKKIRFCQNIDFSSLYEEENQDILISENLLNTEGLYLLPTFRRTLEYQDVTKKSTPEQDFLQLDFERMVRSLEIDVLKIKKNIFSYHDSITEKDFIYNHDIKATTFEVSLLHDTDSKKRWFSKEKAISLAKYRHETVIEDRGRYFIGRVDYFIEWKKRKIMAAYMDSLYRVSNNILNARRNRTNDRLDTNFTNMPNSILGIIMEDNDLVQIDLANSQFAILSHILKDELDTMDYHLFKHHAERGTLYDSVAKEQGIPRKQVKIGFFETLFSSDKFKSPNKENLENTYPSVMQWISDYKQLHGDKSFVNMLQKRESKIFIDGILPRILNETDTCFTKHDSVIIRKKDEKLAYDIINKYLSEIDFKGLLS